MVPLRLNPSSGTPLYLQLVEHLKHSIETGAIRGEQLRERFGLDPGARIKTLSRGQRAKLGLLAAQAHRPDLLILDEPSSGLDPIVRRDILEAIYVNGAGREWTLICDPAQIHGPAMAANLGASIIEDCPASLDEIFVAHAGASPGAPSSQLRSVN